MSNERKIKSQTATLIALIVGVTLIIVSSFYASAFLAIVGLGIIFWSVILFYITPTRQVPLSLLNASVSIKTTNIERILVETGITEKGIYLPPKNLGNIESSLIFVPKSPKYVLPTLEEPSEKLYADQYNGIFLTPPGLALAHLFERELGVSFGMVDLVHLQTTLPKLLVEELGLSENLEIQTHGDLIVIEATGSLLKTICEEADNEPQTHAQVGCLLASALACILAKTTGKPIIIQKETYFPKAKITAIEYRTLEE